MTASEPLELPCGALSSRRSPCSDRPICDECGMVWIGPFACSKATYPEEWPDIPVLQPITSRCVELSGPDWVWPEKETP
jgi:hypothetical protein